MGCYERGEWRPYTEEELLDVLADDIVVTPGVLPHQSHDPRL